VPREPEWHTAVGAARISYKDEPGSWELAAYQALMAKIRANQNLYTRFRATEAFEELDKELKAYEERQER